jgi:lysine-N-methylase
MTLPIKTLPILEQWDCHGCGICCHGASVLLNDADVELLRSQHWDKHPDFRGKKILVRAGLFDLRYRLAHRRDGSCVFQDADKLCRIHREFGYDAKPHVCRLAPLQMIPVDNFAYVTLRRYCPSAAADEGRPLEEQLDQYRRLAEESNAVPNRAMPPKLSHRYRRDWKDALAVAEVFNRFLLDERYPLVRRLVHGLEFCRLFDACKLRKIQGDRLVELLSVLKESAVESSGAFFGDRQSPAGTIARWFRHIALEYMRLYPDFVPETSWGERLRMVRTTLSFLRGKGAVPNLRMELPPANFADLERPLGALPVEVMLPLTRYFERSVVSLRYVMFKGGRFSMIEGFQALALGFPVAMWMLRFVCGPRDPEKQDVVKLVMMLDRGETNLAMLGSQHRWRVNSLMNDRQLARLAAWYAR